MNNKSGQTPGHYGTKEGQKLQDWAVLEEAKGILEQHLPLEAEGYKCSSSTLYEVLIAVAANRSTIEGVCAELVGTPDGETIRGYINEQLRVEDLPQLQEQINAALRANWPKSLRRSGPIEAAIDFHDRPYYGKAEQREALWVRGEAQDGTTRFYRVATVYAIKRKQRLTLGIHFVLPDDEIVGVVADLLGRLGRNSLKISCLYLDKGFASVGVYRYLQQKRQPALIACPIRGKKGGTKALCRGKKSYATKHTFRSGEGQQFTAQLAVCRVFSTNKRTGRNPRKATWLVFVQIHLGRSPKHCRKSYAKRFGIESSYRMSHRLLGWTTSNNPAYRFVLIGLGFILLNLWLHLCWRFTQVPRRGGRYLHSSLFRQERFVNFLVHALERRFARVTFIAAPNPPLL